MYMKWKILPAIIALLLYVFACTAPDHKLTRDENFKMLLDKAKNYVQRSRHIDSALMILHELLPQSQDEGNAVNRGWVLNLTGSAYETKGMYDSSAHYLYQAARLAEKIHDAPLQMSIFSNLGILQFNLKNADEAIKYYRQALAIAEQSKDSTTISNLLNNIGNAYMTLTADFEKAIPYLEQCVEISIKIAYSNGCMVAGINLAMIYQELGELDKAMNEINRLTKLYGHNIYADFLRGGIYYKKENYKAALQEWKELLKKPLNTRDLELTILQNIAEVYTLSHNLDSTVAYLEKAYNLRDTLHNQQSDKTIQELKIIYETEKKDTHIASIEKEKRLLMWLVIAGGSLLLLALTVFLLLYRSTIQKRRLAEKQQQLAEQQIIQLQQERQLVAAQAVLDGEVQERLRLARDLHDGLGSILAAAKYNLVDIKNTPAQEVVDVKRFDKALNLLDESMQEMRRVAHHLMPESLSNLGLKQSISDFCNSISFVKFNWYGEETRFDRKMEVMLYRIIHELVNNALKHSGASHILVEIVRYTDHISLTVQDNGCGFDPSVESKGMGLANIRARVAAYNGNLFIDSKPEVGTEINVELRIE
jgi:signal transduction histidine kinase